MEEKTKKRKHKEECKCFFEELLFDFLQYELFDSYLNYALPELKDICSTAFENIQFIDEKMDLDGQRNCKKNIRLLMEEVMLFEERLDKLNEKDKLLSNEIETCLKKKMLDLGIVNNYLEFLRFIAQTRCPRLISHFVPHHFFICMCIVLLQDKEMFDALILADKTTIIDFLVVSSILDKNKYHRRNYSYLLLVLEAIDWLIDSFPFACWILKKYHNQIKEVFQFDVYKDQVIISDFITIFVSQNNTSYLELLLDHKLFDWYEHQSTILWTDSVENFKYFLLEKKCKIDPLLIEEIPFGSRIENFWNSLTNKEQYIEQE